MGFPPSDYAIAYNIGYSNAFNWLITGTVGGLVAAVIAGALVLWVARKTEKSGSATTPLRKRMRRIVVLLLTAAAAYGAFSLVLMFPLLLDLVKS